MRKKENIPLDYDGAKDKALRLLSFRSHSEYELKQKLLSSGADRDTADAVLTFLREYSLVNDSLYAGRLASDLSNLKKYGKRRIMQELMHKGIDRETAENVCNTLETDEEEALIPLMRKKLGGDFGKKSKDRAIRYFVTRGYSFSDIKSAIGQITSEEDYTDDGDEYYD